MFFTLKMEHFLFLDLEGIQSFFVDPLHFLKTKLLSHAPKTTVVIAGTL